MRKIDWDAAYKELEQKQAALGVQILMKDTSRTQRFIGLLLKPFNDRYMTGFITTLGKNVWWPREVWAKKSARGKFSTMAHELQHVLDRCDHPFMFPFTYIAPQILALPSFLALGAFWNLHFLWFLLALAALIPGIPTKRAYWELRGYKINVSLRCFEEEEIAVEFIEGATKVFTGPSYYWMCRDGDKIYGVLSSAGKQTLMEERHSEAWLNDVLDIVKRHTRS
ncbi:hypothetical protein CMI47_20150 [Candidatus Pacearchaeota archaeon]|nr:hypothetical protein [Candidatus Pacearchaeota archaeon]|tara:strand:- start:1906 stop:2577 length:672 start_codon:yes stop_codon:yes gene_type:complete